MTLTRSLVTLLLAVGAATPACGAAESVPVSDGDATMPAPSDRQPTLPTGPEVDAGDAGPRDASAEAGPRPIPRFKALGERCKLINGKHLDDPTANDTHFRANLRGTDLGIPVAHDGSLYVFFGDTAGVKGIWPFGPESLPDAVGVISHAAVKATPSALCTDLRFLVGSAAASVGRAADPRIERDFAAASMTPPPGHSIAEYIHNPAGPRGGNAFPHLPGDFEVPSGAFSYGGSIYVFYTTVESPTVVEMKGSYLARWTSPSAAGPPAYQILYGVDQRFDANGALRGDFINIASVVAGDYVYLFGSGKYRASTVHLARKKLATLATAGGFERFDAATKTWRAANDASAKPIVTAPAVGELSVQHFPTLGRWAMTTQEVSSGNNRIVVRFAEKPEGPWSPAQAMGSLSDPAFRSKYCCLGDECAGERLFHCDRAGFYAPYLLPDAALRADGSFTLDFVMSTWNPYNVALMSASFDP